MDKVFCIPGLAYSHTERILDEKTGKWKDKRIYESFTSDDPSPRGKKEAEYAAADFQLNKKAATAKKQHANRNKKLTEAIDDYIESRVPLKRSPTTIQDYRCIQRNGFQDLMDTPLKDIDEDIMQEAINVEARRKSNKRSKTPQPISAKRLKNEWILISAVLHKYRKDFDFSEIELPQVTPRVVELPPGHAQDTVQSAGVYGGASGHHRRGDKEAGRAVFRHRNPEPHRDSGDVSAP